MKGRKNKKLLIGSVSTISVLALVITSVVPNLVMNNNDEAQIFDPLADYDFVVPDDFKDIQDAIDEADEGDKIFVRSGTYYAFHGIAKRRIVIDKKELTLQGENKKTTIINGRRSITPIIIKADYVNFSGFTVQKNSINGSSIHLKSENCLIHDNILLVDDYYDGTEYGIRLDNVQFNIFTNNSITGADRGIDFSKCNNNIVQNNVFEYNYYGIGVRGTLVYDFSKSITNRLGYKESVGNIFRNNIFTNNRYGIRVTSPENIIINNTFNSSKNGGVYLYGCSDVVVKDNEFNRCGLEVSGRDVEEYYHDIQNNTVNGKPLYYYIRENYFQVPSDAGQIFLIECVSVTIENVKISTNNSVAVDVIFSKGVVIKNSEFSSNGRGVVFFHSKTCTVQKNNFIDNDRDAWIFTKGYFNFKSIKFRNNYWDSWIGHRGFMFRLFNKKIVGRFQLNRPRLVEVFSIGIRARNYDRNPAKHPFEID